MLVKGILGTRYWVKHITCFIALIFIKTLWNKYYLSKTVKDLRFSPCSLINELATISWMLIEDRRFLGQRLKKKKWYYSKISCQEFWHVCINSLSPRSYRDDAGGPRCTPTHTREEPEARETYCFTVTYKRTCSSSRRDTLFPPPRLFPANTVLRHAQGKEWLGPRILGVFSKTYRNLIKPWRSDFQHLLHIRPHFIGGETNT